ncbi:MAG: hypothetical protein AAF578_11745 [Pseudomonadota bacterium]
MNLEQVTVALRPRSDWESTDLGAKMVRRDANLIYKAWFSLTLPLLLVAAALTWWTPYAGLALLLYWWLEPITDGVILHIISQRLFGQSPTLGSALKQALPIAMRNWIFLLPPMRFHFARSIAMPITQLERLSGSARRQRAKTLNRRIQNFGIGITAAYQHLSFCIYFGIALISLWLLPEAQQANIDSWLWQLFYAEPSERTVDLASLLLFYAAQTALHPWFVGAGFGLYINCRSRLEAWDIEVAFRRAIALRGKTAAATIVVLAGLALGDIHQNAYADAVNAPDSTPLESYWNAEDVEAASREVFFSEEFNTVETRYELQARWNLDSDSEEESEREASSAALSGFAQFVALLAEFGLWIAIALFVLLLVMTRDRWLPAKRHATQTTYRKTRLVVSGEVVDSEELPDNVPEEARALWDAGEHRKALSLIFRSSVINAIERFDLRLPDSATEGICMRAVSKSAHASYGQDFRRITEQWLRCAYGGRTPTDNEFESICQSEPVMGVAPA